MREGLNSKKNSALTVKSVDSNMNKKKKKKEEEIELPSKKNNKRLQRCMPDSSSALRISLLLIFKHRYFYIISCPRE